MKRTNKIQDFRKERQFKWIKWSLYTLFFILFSLNSFSQDSISFPEDLNEEKELKFQKYFFKALSEKAINNFQKAIENLESCNQILANDVSVFFEFSKNYYRLNKTQLAKEYIERALVKEPKNIWMLQHLVAVHQQSNNYSEAILVQKNIVENNPKNSKLKELLSKLYLRNKQPKKALFVLQTLEKQSGLPKYLKRVKTSLEKRTTTFRKVDKPIILGSLADKFEADKTYKSLEELLKNSKDAAILLKYSLKGIQLFPAQPYVYLVQGQVLNDQKLYKKALVTLQNGIDFVIENNLENIFFKQIAKSYKGLGNNNAATKYLKKLKQ